MAAKCRTLERRDKLDLTSDAPAIRLLIAFVRELVRGCGSDHVILAMGAAASQLGIPADEVEKALSPILRFQKENSIWPSGFMP